MNFLCCNSSFKVKTSLLWIALWLKVEYPFPDQLLAIFVERLTGFCIRRFLAYRGKNLVFRWLSVYFVHFLYHFLLMAMDIAMRPAAELTKRWYSHSRAFAFTERSSTMHCLSVLAEKSLISSQRIYFFRR